VLKTALALSLTLSPPRVSSWVWLAEEEDEDEEGAAEQQRKDAGRDRETER